MKKFVIGLLVLVAIFCGFVGVLALARAFNNTFDWHMNLVFPQVFDVGNMVGLALFVGSMVFLAIVAWQLKKPLVPLLRRIDMAVLAVAFIAVFHICYQMVRDIMLTPWEVLHGLGGLLAETFVIINMSHFSQDLIVAPIVAYAAGIILYMEFVQRLRDRNIVLHWYDYFTKHPFWPGGLSAAAMLAALVYVSWFDTAIYVRTSAVAALILSSFFAEFLLHFSRQFDAANAEKIQAERFKAELITNVSHDIKTPLTSIINYVDLLKSERLDGKAAQYVQVLDNKSARLKVLIDDLMEASKAGTGNMKVDMQEINLGELVGQIAGEFEDSFAESNLTLVLRQPDEAIFLETDSRHLYRVLENLFSNVAKYALSGTRAFLEIALHEGMPRIVVQNTSASPISLSDGEVTEQFIRGDKARSTEGSGLGLYIAKSLVELLGGEFSIDISGDLFRVVIVL